LRRVDQRGTSYSGQFQKAHAEAKVVADNTSRSVRTLTPDPSPPGNPPRRQLAIDRGGPARAFP